MILLKFIIPVALWFFVWGHIFSSEALIGSESFYIYSIVKYYLDHLAIGIFPLWDPFVAWGSPTQIYFNYIGIFNPLWLLAWAGKACGLSAYQAFVVTMTIYFALGQWGFYLLARQWLHHSVSAYVSFLLFLFSSVSISLFSQFHVPLIYVPSIWFFYFGIVFLKRPHWHAGLGLIYTLSIILSSYLPFYFLTVLGCIFGSMLLVYGLKFFIDRFKIAASYLGEHKILSIVFVLILGLAFLPGYQAYWSTVNKEVAVPFRNSQVDKKSGVDINDYHKTAMNSLSGRMDLIDIVANLDNIRYGDDGFFYLSVFFYILLFVGAFLVLRREMVVMWIVAVSIFVLMMTSAFGVHRFLFEHIFYFRLIRNMHFFLPFFIGILVLLAGSIFDEYVAIKNKSAAFNKWLGVGVLAGHLGLGVFLLTQEFVILSTFLSIGLSAVFWGLFFWSPGHSRNILRLILLMLAILVQPAEVLWRHNQRGILPVTLSAKQWIRSSVALPRRQPEFEYRRQKLHVQEANDESAYARASMTDGPLSFNVGFPAYDTYRLTQNVDSNALIPYVAVKFYLYDDALPWNKSHPDWSELKKNFEQKRNAVYLWPLASPLLKGPSAQLLKIEKEEPYFKVTSFQANQVALETSFPTEKILVYTDSYHAGWKAWVNDRAVDLYLANGAFKGLVLPAGANRVVLRFEAPVMVGVWVVLESILLLSIIILIGFPIYVKFKNITNR